jgi:hypothetical protein
MTSSTSTRPRAPEIRHHQRQRLLLARLAHAQARNRRGVAGIHEQVEAPQALRRDDLSPPQRRGGDAQRLVAGGPHLPARAP